MIFKIAVFPAGSPTALRTQRPLIHNVIDRVDQRLQDWIGSLAKPVRVSLSAPAEMQGKQGVSLHLLELLGNPPPRGVHRPPLSFSLRYLVTVWLDDAVKAHRLLGDLAFSAMEEKDLELEPGSVPLDAWQAFGVAPRPSFVLKVVLNKPRPEKLAPLVRGKMSVRFGAMRPLEGQVFGPGRVPIMAATVLLPSLQMTARTDYKGRFRFAAVPKEPPLTEVQVNARGHDVSLQLPAGAGDGPLLIELNETQI